MTIEEEIEMLKDNNSTEYICYSKHSLVWEATQKAIAALEEQPRKVTKKALVEFFNKSLDFLNRESACNGLIKCFDFFQFLESDTEPKYQWLWKLQSDKEWFGVTKYMTKSDFEVHRNINAIYERIESSRQD